jgi:hypothetical protein
MEKISRRHRVRNEEVLQRVKEESNTLHITNEGRVFGLIISCIGFAYKNKLLKEI